MTFPHLLQIHKFLRADANGWRCIPDREVLDAVSQVVHCGALTIADNRQAVEEMENSCKAAKLFDHCFEGIVFG